MAELLPHEINGRFKEVVRQRDEALQRCVALAGAFAHIMYERDELLKERDSAKEAQKSPESS